MCVRPADVRYQPTGCALNLYRSSRWGAPRLRAATTLPSLLARLFPSGAQSPTLSLPLAARARPSALTLIPPAHSRKTERPFRLLRCSFAAPRFSLSAHRLRFSLAPGFALLCGRARPATLSPSRDAPCAYSPTVGCRGRSPFFEKTGEEETFLCLRRENNQFSKVRFRFNMRGFRVPRAPATARRGGYSLTMVLGTPRCPATY